jgi:hypothetical protein
MTDIFRSLQANRCRPAPLRPRRQGLSAAEARKGDNRADQQEQDDQLDVDEEKGRHRSNLNRKRIRLRARNVCTAP